MNSCCETKSIETSVCQDILDTLDTGIIFYDENGIMKHSNARAFEILAPAGGGIPNFNDLIGFVFDNSLDYDDQSQLSLFSIRDGQKVIFNEIIQVGASEYYAVRAVSNEQWEQNKNVVVELFDISQIKNRTDDMLWLDKKNRILTKAIQSSEKGIFIAENKEFKKIVFANDAVSRLLGHHDHSLMERSVEEFLSREFNSGWEDIENTLTEGGQGFFWRCIDEVSVKQKWLRLHLCVYNHDVTDGMIVGFISDETENKSRESQLLQNQKLEAIGQLAGGVAHDFNNILSIIEGYIRLSESAFKRGEDISGNIARIKQAVARGSGLTKQLLMFGKHRVTENKIIDLCGQLQDIEVLLSPLLGVNIDLKFQIPNEVLPIKSTPDMMSQIVMNLVINARDAMPEGGKITLSAYKHFIDGEGVVLLEIKDTGSGISQDIIDKIFDPFFTTKEQGKGTGLGLSMVYGLVQQMGGDIDVQSIIGKGTTFSIQIPMAEGDCTDIIQFPKRHTEDMLQGKVILLAEDEPDLLEIMEATLLELGLKVLKAKNGIEALEIQDEFVGHIDFLLTDMVMPQLGGLKLAELMKEVRPETHIVFMSGYPVRGDIANINLPEDATFMAKPVKPEFLRHVFEDFLSGHSIENTNATTWKT